MPPVERGGATRPSLPALGWFAVSMWAGIALGEGAVWRAAPLAWALIACGAWFAVAGILACRLRGRAFALPAVAGLGVGFVVGIVFWTHLGAVSERLTSAGSGPFTCEVVADPRQGAFGYWLEARIEGGAADGARVRVMTSGEERPPGCGRLIDVRGRARREQEGEWARKAHRAGSAGRITAWRLGEVAGTASLRGLVAPARESLLAEVNTIPGTGGALLQGVLLGEKSRIRGTALEEDFRTAGLSHLLAVSGTHISIVATLIGGLLVRAHVPLHRRLILVLAVAGSYVLLTGAPVSSLRAFVMTIAGGLCMGVGRRGDSLGGLSAAIVVLLACSPPVAFDLGFSLSVCAVGGLIAFSPLAQEWCRVAVSRRAGALASALSVPVVAQFSTMPVAVPAFNMISVVGPVANAIVLPVASAGLGAGVVGCAAYPALRPLGRAVLRAAAALFGAIGWVVERLASLPRAAVAVGGGGVWWGIGCAAACALLWAVWPRPRSRTFSRMMLAVLIATSAVFVIGPQAVGGARFAVLDVGQGDAVLVADGGAAILVDAGPDASSMRAAIARTGVRKLDAVVLTHAHADHDGGLEGLTGVVDVASVIVPVATCGEFDDLDDRARELTGAAPVLVEQGDRIAVGGWTVVVLWPPGDAAGFETNDTSLMIEAAHGSFRAVLTGDAERAPQDGLLEAGALRSCDVLKVPHHGSAEGISGRALDVWSPCLALVSVGAGNDYAHPAAETIALLASRGARVERTDLSGDLTVHVDGDSYTLRTARRGQDVVGFGIHGRPRYRWVPCETMTAAPERAVPLGSFDGTDACGRYRSRRTQAGLSHLRVRGPPARAGR